MIALFGLLDLIEVAFQFLLIKERSSVDPGELLALLIPPPVRPRDRQQLECLDLPCTRHVRPAAQVKKIALLIG
jgi:hypothetical protein